MASIHLNVMKLERYGQSGLEQSLTIFAPHHHWIAELIGILVDDAVEFRLYHGRCSDNYMVFKESALAFICCLLGQFRIVAIELLYVIGVRNVAGVDASLAVLYNDVNGKLIIAIQLPIYRQRKELLHWTRSLAYTPTQQCGELQAALLPYLYQAGDIKIFHQRYHRHR